MEPIELGVFSLLAAQRQVSGSPAGSPATIAKMIEFTARRKIEPVTEHFSFDQKNEALAHFESGKARYRIVLSQ